VAVLAGDHVVGARLDGGFQHGVRVGGLGANSTRPTRSNMKETAPVSARLPPLLVK
jgi:hypothetical protein